MSTFSKWSILEMKGNYLIIFPCCCKNNFQEGKIILKLPKSRFYNIHRNSKIFIIKQLIFFAIFWWTTCPKSCSLSPLAIQEDTLERPSTKRANKWTTLLDIKIITLLRVKFWLTLNMLIFWQVGDFSWKRCGQKFDLDSGRHSLGQTIYDVSTGYIAYTTLRVLVSSNELYPQFPNDSSLLHSMKT